MPELMTLREAAEKLKTTVKTLYAWRKAGDLAFVKIGGQNRITADELTRFVDAGRGEAPRGN